MIKELTKEEFLARCANAYDSGLITKDLMHLMEDWLDAMMRLEHSLFTTGQSQFHYVWDFLTNERARLFGERDAYCAAEAKTLAADTDGYKLIQLAAILAHACQECATDPNAWWTRSAFCPHNRGYLSNASDND